MKQRRICNLFYAFFAKNKSHILGEKSYICKKLNLGMAKYIYQNENWTDFTWNDKKISVLTVTDVSQGRRTLCATQVRQQPDTK